MNLFLRFFVAYAFLITNLMADENPRLTDADYFVIHSTQFPMETIDAPLEVYDNKVLQGDPIYIIDNKKIVDLKNGKKEYDYKTFYSVSKKAGIEGDYPVKELSKIELDFVKLNFNVYVLAIESKENDILKITGKDLYFKAADKNLKAGIERAMRWKSSKSPEVIKKLLKEDEVFKTFFNKLSTCVKSKNNTCLFNLSRGFEDAAIEWTLKQSPEVCAKMSETGVYDPDNFKTEIKNIKKVLVNWNLYEEFIKLDNPNMEILEITSDFGSKQDIYFSLEGNGCVASTKFGINIKKEKGRNTLMIMTFMAGEGG